MDNGHTPRLETAIFAAGCFWGVEETFRQIPGVKDTIVGYSGGTTENPSYQDVCTGRTGHAEAVKVTYDPSEVTYEQLLDVFWQSHDPTTPNRQGPDVGTQYRSAIFFSSPQQEETAQKSKEARQQSGSLKRSIVTQITPASAFYPAEEYHQQYLAKRNMAACRI